MKRHLIIIPKDYLYLGLVKNYILDGKEVNEPLKLFKGVFNKKLPNVGGTTLVLKNEEKVILVSPRNQLLINKHKQTPDSLLINADHKGNIKEYVNNTAIPKILTTYDSLPKVISNISDIESYHIIIDEFQMLLLDSGFKSEVEQSLIEMIKGLNVTFLSATPLSESCLVYLAEIFNDLDYYELEYERPIEKIQIQRIESNSPIKAIINILNEYYILGNYPTINNKTSKEVVVFLNSVTNIIKIVKTLNLNSEEVNIICADSTENENKIKKNLGSSFNIGEIAVNKEDNKKYTFVTSTAFEGVDFYSDNAATFIVSDTTTEHTTIDIEFELQQIVGRQRLEENIFRMYPYLIYNSKKRRSNQFIKEYLEQMDIIEKRTNRELARLNSITDEEDIKLEAKKLYSLLMVTNYEESYSIYNEHLKKFVFNRCYKLNQLFKLDYYNNSLDGVYIYGQINNTNNMTTNREIQTLNFNKEDIENIMIQTDSFKDVLKRYLENKYDMNKEDYLSKYPQIKIYCELLTADQIKSLGYQESKLKIAIKEKLLNGNEVNKICWELGKYDNELVTKDQIKDILTNLYIKYNITNRGKLKTAKTTDLKLYGYEAKRKQIREDGKVISKYIITKIQ